MNEGNLQSVHYRVMCKVIIQEMKEIDNNWRNGNLKKILIRNNFCLRGLDYFNGAIGYEHIAISDTLWHWDREKMLAFLHRSRLTVESWITVPRGSSAVTNWSHLC